MSVASQDRPGSRPGISTRRLVVRAIFYAALLFVAVLIITPLVYAILSGFRTTGQLAAQPLGLPDPWVWDNFLGVLQSSRFTKALWNSTVIAVLTTILTLITASLAAFVLARFEFRGRGLVFNVFALGLLFPLAVAILPLFLLLHGLGLLDNPWGVVLPQIAYGLPTSIIILRPFFRSIPGEIEDAAVIDGCTRFSFYRRILLPMSRPALTTIGVLTIIGSWNAFLLPLIVISSADQATLPLAVRNFQAQYTQDTARVLAFAALSMIPALVFYVAAERQIVSGLAAGAVKG